MDIHRRKYSVYFSVTQRNFGFWTPSLELIVKPSFVVFDKIGREGACRGGDQIICTNTIGGEGAYHS